MVMGVNFDICIRVKGAKVGDFKVHDFWGVVSLKRLRLLKKWNKNNGEIRE